MTFYPSKTHDRLNGLEFNPQQITRTVMLNPITPAYNISEAIEVKIDSGAFQEVYCRKTPKLALTRQLRYKHKLDLRGVKRIVIFTYDQMGGVDEAIINGKKVKIRGTRETAIPAIEATLHAARFYNANRNVIKGPIGFVCQGIDPEQYINDCAKPILDLMQDEDVFGFGGFCIVGRVPSLKPKFYDTFTGMMSLLYRKGIKHVHIMGVCVTDVIRFAIETALPYGIEVSTDSASPETNGAAFGKRFIDEKWVPFYKWDQKYIDYHPCKLALQNVEDYHKWIEDFKVLCSQRLLSVPSLQQTPQLSTLV